MFKKKKWYEDILDKKYNTREKMYNNFEKAVLNAKIDGYNKEEMKMMFIGHANVHVVGMYNYTVTINVVR